MDFSSGNSGNLLRPAVIKVGPECQQEGAYAQLLGENVCPKIYAIIPNGYVMEALYHPSPLVLGMPEFLSGISGLLWKFVWMRPALPTTLDTDWRDALKVYGVNTPDWVEPKEFCMVHGDPTVSNALFTEDDLRIADPRPPRNYIPQCRETDLGRILQSWFGWEVAAYGWSGYRWNKPQFQNDLEEDRSHFWCGAAAARIEYLELTRTDRPKRDTILDWCRSVRRVCNV